LKDFKGRGGKSVYHSRQGHQIAMGQLIEIKARRPPRGTIQQGSAETHCADDMTKPRRPNIRGSTAEKAPDIFRRELDA
jgi:hypothetical protein